jgi:sugar/nucleoside kinase (ribokinase family)
LPTIHVIGNVQLDVLANPVTSMPKPGGDSIIDRVDVRPAGAAGNVSLALAALGAPHRLFAAVGDDYAGRWVLAEFEKLKLDQDILVKPGATGISIAVEAPGRERAFITAHGVLADWTLEDLPDDATAADYVLITGHFSLPALRPATHELLKKARANGATTILDTGWDPDDWLTTGRQEILDLLPLVDLFLPNEPEALALTNLPIPHDAATTLTRHSGHATILKRGPYGALLTTPTRPNGRPGAAEPGADTIVIPAPPAVPLDTTGAGDSLAAALLAELATGKPLPEALAFAVAYASAVVTRPSHNRHPLRTELPR